ncbi:hypothetical protein ACJX0J_025448, partial [Zea mays]
WQQTIQNFNKVLSDEPRKSEGKNINWSTFVLARYYIHFTSLVTKLLLMFMLFLLLAGCKKSSCCISFWLLTLIKSWQPQKKSSSGTLNFKGHNSYIMYMGIDCSLVRFYDILIQNL